MPNNPLLCLPSPHGTEMGSEQQSAVTLFYVISSEEFYSTTVTIAFHARILQLKRTFPPRRRGWPGGGCWLPTCTVSHYLFSSAFLIRHSPAILCVTKAFTVNNCKIEHTHKQPCAERTPSSCHKRATFTKNKKKTRQGNAFLCPWACFARQPIEPCLRKRAYLSKLLWGGGGANAKEKDRQRNRRRRIPKVSVNILSFLPRQSHAGGCTSKKGSSGLFS